jgi:ribosome-binding protein aMBF1 (putative translation factor)
MKPQDAAVILYRLDWSDQQMADAVASSQPVINRIRRGERQASFDVGNALIALAKKEEAKARRRGKSNGTNHA